MFLFYRCSFYSFLSRYFKSRTGDVFDIFYLLLMAALAIGNRKRRFRIASDLSVLTTGRETRVSMSNRIVCS